MFVFSLSHTLLLAYYGRASFPPPSRSPASDELMSQPPNLRLPFYPPISVLRDYSCFNVNKLFSYLLFTAVSDLKMRNLVLLLAIVLLYSSPASAFWGEPSFFTDFKTIAQIIGQNMALF